ncbi:MAG: flagellar hook-associated protein FlgL [Gammaproteobacteria bacterium]|nr:flagellar hook-associated protein FlgL [Gammaproteobacteria bacterium]
MTRITTAYLFQKTAIDIASKQFDISEIQNQIGTGKRLNKPSDGPAETARVIDLNQAIGRIDQFQRNSIFANQRLGLEDATLSSVNNSLLRVRDLALQANSGSQTGETRAIIRAEVEQRLQELLDYANARDGNGNYLFSGSKNRTQPFTQTATGVAYNGDQNQLSLKISGNRTIVASDSGYDIFVNIKNGNGDFVTSSNAANTGDGVITVGSVIDNSVFQANDFSITFTSPTTFDVVNNTTATTILAGQNYVSGQAINFNGSEVAISGDPQAGDEFQVNASRRQDVFATLQSFINALGTDPSDPADQAQLTQALDRTISDVDNALQNVLNTRTFIGTRQNSIDTANIENEGAKIELQTTRSQIEDLDYAQAITQLQLQQTTLQAIQGAFAQVRGQSLFNFL